MKHSISNCVRLTIVVFVAALLVACGKDDVELKVGNWGPQSMVVGNIPNKQPDGGLGMWIEVSRDRQPGELQILLDGIPQATAISEKVVTTSVPPAQLMQPGRKEITIRNVALGRTFPVGTFVINPAQ